MNNQPKYGDTVTITNGERKGTVGKIGSKVNYSQCTVITDDEFIIISTSDVAPYSPTPDMLAIPDDHVFTETNNQK